MAISAQEVNKLRQITGAGMMDCKVALTESNGDFDLAIEFLRKKGQKVSEKRADRETKEGTVFIQSNADNSLAVLVAIGCETDFVAKNDDFQNLGKEVLSVAFEKQPAGIEELKALKAGSITVGEKVTDLVGKIGEKIDVIAYEVLKGERVVSYIHAGSKLGVLVALKGVQGADVADAGRNVAMQIAAMNPVSVSKENVPANVIERELSIGREQAINEGKPANMIDKIAEGKLNKFFKENTLLSQTFVKDNNMTIAQYLDSVKKGLTVETFKRISVAS
jgi:elongation factor Ts